MKSPIYTEKTICRDCYKCVRHCPVKAIKVVNGSAEIMYDQCIFCGKCIEVCPVNAKKLRSDIGRAKQLIDLNSTVIASLAPSFPAEFDCSSKSIISALKKLGFSGVSETSIGAEIVSRNIAEKMLHGKENLISSACPTVKELIRKYRPDLISRMADLVSPLYAHADFLKKKYGSRTKVIFIGPCISKKTEADDKDTPIDLALTFIELKNWFEEEKIILEECTDGTENFIPEKAVNAAEFAIEGGMINTIKMGATAVEPNLISCSGINNIMNTFDDIAGMADQNLFLEYLACDGGCISGMGMTSHHSYLEKRLRVLKYFQQHRKNQNISPPPFTVDIEKVIQADPVPSDCFSEKQIEDVLRTLDKTKIEDEINCGGCGYNTCRNFAAALLEGKAEPAMCVTNMRKLAEKKSNALMKALPLGVVITDRAGKILECNEKFISLFSEIDPEMAGCASKHVEGIALERFIPDFRLFEKLKRSELSMSEDKLKIDKRVFRIFTFMIGQEDMLGAVFQDITSPVVRRETIIRKTEEVIEKNLSSVQQIASLLGENAAETQLILNSLIESFNDNSTVKDSL